MSSTNDQMRPHWDGMGHLWLGKRLLYHFGRRAPSQMPILAALQTAGWPRAPIPNPIPLEPGEAVEDAGDRLHHTVKNLNRRMPRGTIRFRDDRAHVWWEPAVRRRS